MAKIDVRLRDWKHKPPIKTGSNGRDERGRFVKGNPGGPGRPKARTLSEAVRAELEKQVGGRVDLNYAQLIAQVLINEASVKRNSKAWSEIRELTEAKKIVIGTWQDELEAMILSQQLTVQQAIEVIDDDSLAADFFKRPRLQHIDYRPSAGESGTGHGDETSAES